jgi:DNA-binding transcriptional LysR family regulator
MPDMLGNMRAFLLTVDTGTFSGAARKMRVAPSVVTKRVRQLEWAVRGKLFDRSTRSVKLTELGQQYLVSIRQVVREYDDIVSGATRSPQKIEGNIRIKGSYTPAMLELLPAIWQFQQKFPAVVLDVSLESRTINPVEENCDLAIGIMPQGGSYEGVIEEPLLSVSRVLCASPEYLASHPPPVTPQDLTTHDCIAYSQVDPAWIFKGPSGPVKVAVRPKVAANNNIVIFSAACAGCGIAIMSRLQAEPAIRAGKLVEVELPNYPVQELWLKAYIPETRSKLARVQTLMKELRAAVAVPKRLK